MACEGPHPFIPAPNVAQVRAIGSLHGSIVSNVFYFEKESQWTGAELQTLAGQVGESWDAFISPNIATDYVLTAVKARGLDTQEDAYGETTENAAGDLVSPGLPNNCTVAIKFATALSGRSNRGRMFLAGLTEAQVLGDQLVAGMAATLAGAVAAFFGEVAGATGSQHVVVSYCNGGEWRTTAVTTPVTAYTCDGIMDSQRRRLLGRGR
jgi:hypothetical protein